MNVLFLSVGVAVLRGEAHRVTETLLKFPLLKLTDDTDQRIPVIQYDIFHQPSHLSS